MVNRPLIPWDDSVSRPPPPIRPRMRRAEAGSPPPREAADAIHHQPGRLLLHFGRYHGCDQGIRKTGARSAHLQPPHPWRMSAPFEAFADRRDLGIRTVRLHRGDADHQMKRFAIDSRSDRGAYFSSGGYDLLLAPLRGVR